MVQSLWEASDHERGCHMSNVFVTLVLSTLTSSTLIAQVTPSYSSVTSRTLLSLTGDNGDDSVIVVDDQAAENAQLSAVADAGFTNSNGSFTAHTEGTADFLDASAGSFMASSSFSGMDSGSPGAMGSFAHTLSCEFEYQFLIDGEGSIDVNGLLENSSVSFESFVRLSMSSETVVGGGFVGFFYDESILDTANSGAVFFSRTIPLNAASGSYRLRLLLSHSGLGLREQAEVTASLMSNFGINIIDPCPVDLNDDGMVNFFDVSVFLSAYTSMDPVADYNHDGIINFFDVSVFLSDYTAGCP